MHSPIIDREKKKIYRNDITTTHYGKNIILHIFVCQLRIREKKLRPNIFVEIKKHVLYMNGGPIALGD